MTPRLLLDLDGPLADFDAAFYDGVVSLDIAFDRGIFGPADFRKRFATDHIPDKGSRAIARRMVETPGWFEALDHVPGALEGVDELARWFDVWLVTKPLEANPTCRDEKAAWVRRHLGAEWERRLVITPDKSVVDGTLLLDDAPHLDWLPRASWLPVIFPMPWNGDGSKWGDFALRWGWGDPIDRLTLAATAAQRAFA